MESSPNHRLDPFALMWQKLMSSLREVDSALGVVFAAVEVVAVAVVAAAAAAVMVAEQPVVAGDAVAVAVVVVVAAAAAAAAAAVVVAAVEAFATGLVVAAGMAVYEPDAAEAFAAAVAGQ